MGRTPGIFVSDLRNRCLNRDPAWRANKLLLRIVRNGRSVFLIFISSATFGLRLSSGLSKERESKSDEVARNGDNDIRILIDVQINYCLVLRVARETTCSGIVLIPISYAFARRPSPPYSVVKAQEREPKEVARARARDGDNDILNGTLINMEINYYFTLCVAEKATRGVILISISNGSRQGPSSDILTPRTGEIS